MIPTSVLVAAIVVAIACLIWLVFGEAIECFFEGVRFGMILRQDNKDSDADADLAIQIIQSPAWIQAWFVLMRRGPRHHGVHMTGCSGRCHDVCHLPLSEKFVHDCHRQGCPRDKVQQSPAPPTPPPPPTA